MPLMRMPRRNALEGLIGATQIGPDDLANRKGSGGSTLSRMAGGALFLASRDRLDMMSKPTPKGDWSERRLCQIVNLPRRSLPRLNNATTKVTHIRKIERLARWRRRCGWGWAR